MRSNEPPIPIGGTVAVGVAVEVGLGVDEVTGVGTEVGTVPPMIG